LLLAAFGAQADNRESNRKVTGSFESNSHPSARKHHEDHRGGVHPTFNIPVIFDETADLAPTAISAVPEPGTVLMMLIGVGMIGAIVRRRTKDNAA
jgi:hypothetical protein